MSEATLVAPSQEMHPQAFLSEQVIKTKKNINLNFFTVFYHQFYVSISLFQSVCSADYLRKMRYNKGKRFDAAHN